MFSLLPAGLARELQAILTLYLGTVLIGFSIGYSAVATPDIKNEMRQILHGLSQCCVNLSISERMSLLHR